MIQVWPARVLHSPGHSDWLRPVTYEWDKHIPNLRWDKGQSGSENWSFRAAGDQKEGNLRMKPTQRRKDAIEEKRVCDFWGHCLSLYIQLGLKSMIGLYESINSHCCVSQYEVVHNWRSAIRPEKWSASQVTSDCFVAGTLLDVLRERTVTGIKWLVCSGKWTLQKQDMNRLVPDLKNLLVHQVRDNQTNK